MEAAQTLGFSHTYYLHEQAITKFPTANDFYLQTIDFLSDESDDDILTVKRADHDFADANDEDENDEPLLTPESKVKIVTKAALAKKVMKKKIQSNTVSFQHHF